jgi:hypothetical protein
MVSAREALGRGPWRAFGLAALIVVVFAAGAVARGEYDARNARRVGGYTHAQLSSLPLLVQGAGTTGNAVRSSQGVALQAAGAGTMTFGFVVPRDHEAGTPLWVDLVYADSDAGACSWYAYAEGLEGPDSDTGPDIHNGGWVVPGNDGYDGPVSVQAGEGSVHTARFRWPFPSDPGMFIQFSLTRAGDDTLDTCGGIQVYAAQLRY